MTLAAYLAQKYLTSSKDPSDPSERSTRPRKRRKKDESTTESSTLIIADDDADLSLRSTATARVEDDDHPIYDQSYHSAEFRKAKKNNWKALATTPAAVPENNAGERERAEADRILATAAADQAAHRAEVDNDDSPAIVDVAVALQDSSNDLRMSSGVRAGLQTAADSERLEIERAQEAEAALKKAKKKSAGRDAPPPPEEQTVYRDATGRRIDISLKRAELRAAEVAKRKAEQQAKEEAMGEVQRAEKARQKEEVADARFLTVARGVEDEEMNEELRGKVRWDDPMAAYVLQKQAEEEGPEAGRSTSTTQATMKKMKKEYQGAAPPNRYGIRPGWRWDGVDRGNGFERDWFQARGKQARRADLEYQWQMDE